MIEFAKTAVYVILTAVMLLAEIFFPGEAEAVSGFYVSVLAAYLGIDVAGMIRATALLPQGEFKAIKSYRYVVCAAGYVVLIVAGCVMRARGQDYGKMFGTFISALIITGTLYMGALEGNKIATSFGKGKEDSE